MLNEPGNVDEEYKLKNSSVAINSFGGIKHLTINGKEIIRNNHEPCVTYNSYGSEDYDYWFEHYSRNLKKLLIGQFPISANRTLTKSRTNTNKADLITRLTGCPSTNPTMQSS